MIKSERLQKFWDDFEVLVGARDIPTELEAAIETFKADLELEIAKAKFKENGGE